MSPQPERTITAFAGARRVATGSAASVAVALRRLKDSNDDLTFLVFDAETSAPVELDVRGTLSDVAARYADPEKPGPGRPKLGVVAREVTLLPRHWEWLATQPGGASITLRRLVEAASKNMTERDRIRKSQDAAYKFMMAIAGNLPQYEEALRALYASKKDAFEAMIATWPEDIRDHVAQLALPALR